MLRWAELFHFEYFNTGTDEIIIHNFHYNYKGFFIGGFLDATVCKWGGRVV